MTGSDFLTAELARIAWLDGGTDGVSGAKACAFTIRNRVRAGWYGGNWSEVLSHHQDWRAQTTPLATTVPDPRDPGFRILLQDVSAIFSGQVEDTITIAQDSIGSYMRMGGLSVAAPPVLYYARLNEIDDDKFLENISRNHDKHKRIATVGSLVFWT